MIEMRDVCKKYPLQDNQELSILKGISLKIHSGDFVVIMSPSGAGKSTLMNIMGCLDRFDSGTYTLAGAKVNSLSDNELAHVRNQKIGFVFQSFHLLPRLSAVENIALPLMYKRKNGSGKGNSKSLLELVGLGKRSDHFPGQLSGGEQQRVAIARALVNDPKLILADEPTGNLDEKNGVEVMNILKKLNEDGKTIVMVTHDDAIAEYAKRTIRLDQGKLVEN